MKVWTIILAGVLLAALPNLGSGVRSDAGVFVAKTYPNFQMRTVPAPRNWACTKDTHDNSWWQINLFESLLRDFRRGNNTMNATFCFGTPSLLMAEEYSAGKFLSGLFCKYLPTRYQNATLSNKEVESMKTAPNQQIDYFAVKVNDTARATIETGFNYLKTVLKNQFPNSTKWSTMIVEKTADGKVYVGSRDERPRP